jgi:hypothetical protein
MSALWCIHIENDFIGNDLMFDMKSLAKGICLATNIARKEKKSKASLRVLLSFKSYRHNQRIILSFSEDSHQMTLPTLKWSTRRNHLGRTPAATSAPLKATSRVFPTWHKPGPGNSNYQSQSRKVLLNMMVDSSLIALEIRTNRAF